MRLNFQSLCCLLLIDVNYLNSQCCGYISGHFELLTGDSFTFISVHSVIFASNSWRFMQTRFSSSQIWHLRSFYLEFQMYPKLKYISLLQMIADAIKKEEEDTTCPGLIFILLCLYVFVDRYVFVWVTLWCNALLVLYTLGIIVCFSLHQNAWKINWLRTLINHNKY